MSAETPNGATESTLAELQELVERAADGSAAARASLRNWLSTHSDYWGAIAQNAVDLREKLITAIAGKDVLLAEALSTTLERLRGELLMSSPSAIEALQFEQLSLCRLSIFLVGQQILGNKSDGPKLHWSLKNLAQAQKNFAAASKQLAVIQRLSRRPSSARRPATTTAPSQAAPAVVAAAQRTDAESTAPS
jgi:hypothetical protein